MHHIVANSLALAQNVETDVTPITDTILPLFNGHFFPQDPPSLIFAAAMSTNIVDARIQTPTLSRLTSPHIRGVMSSLVPNSPAQIADYVNTPLNLAAREEIIVFGTQSAVAATRLTTLLGLMFSPSPPAVGQQYTMRGSSTTAVVANAWTTLQITWSNQLPQGNYAVTGLQHISANGQAARVIFLGGYYRPGSMSGANLGDAMHRIFRLGVLGQWGTFRDNIIPTIEVLCNAADASHTLYLDFMPL